MHFPRALTINQIWSLENRHLHSLHLHSTISGRWSWHGAYIQFDQGCLPVDVSWQQVDTFGNNNNICNKSNCKKSVPHFWRVFRIRFVVFHFGKPAVAKSDEWWPNKWVKQQHWRVKSKAKRAVQGKQVKQAKKKQKNSKKTNTKKLLGAAARKVFCGCFRFLRCFCSFTVVAKSFPIFPFSFSFSLHASTGCTAPQQLNAAIWAKRAAY